jgi:single-strand DNA-binding protein
VVENVAASLQRGAAVVATGRLSARTWETREDDKRATGELTVDDIGPSLRRAVVEVTRATRYRGRYAVERCWMSSTITVCLDSSIR